MADKTVGVDGVGSKGSFKLPVSDEKMSIRHLQDTMEYNLKHAEEHLKAAKESCERLCTAKVPHKIPRSLVDLGEYFERKGGYEQSVDKLKQHIKSSYNTKS